LEQELRTAMSPTVQARRATFRALHLEGCFVLPNPWDVGSAVMLQGLGFKALATTSSGHAWSLAIADGSASRAALLEHLRAIVGATDLPVNADFESAFAVDPAGVAESVRMAIETGVAGLSIEDSTGTPEAPIRPVGEQSAFIGGLGSVRGRNCGGSPGFAPACGRPPRRCERSGPQSADTGLSAAGPQHVGP